MKLHRNVKLSFGYAHLFGGGVVRGAADDHVDFAYGQVLFSY